MPSVSASPFYAIFFFFFIGTIYCELRQKRTYAKCLSMRLQRNCRNKRRKVEMEIETVTEAEVEVAEVPLCSGSVSRVRESVLGAANPGLRERAPCTGIYLCVCECLQNHLAHRPKEFQPTTSALSLHTLCLWPLLQPCCVEFGSVLSLAVCVQFSAAWFQLQLSAGSRGRPTLSEAIRG